MNPYGLLCWTSVGHLCLDFFSHLASTDFVLYLMSNIYFILGIIWDYAVSFPLLAPIEAYALLRFQCSPVFCCDSTPSLYRKDLCRLKIRICSVGVDIITFFLLIILQQI